MVDHPLMLPVCCTFDGFVLNLLLNVYMDTKYSSSLYEAFEMKDTSCEGPI